MRASYRAALWALSLGAAGLTAGAASATACVSAGVITRIDGRPQEVQITRDADGGPIVVQRPRVLEVVCAGDVISVTGTSRVTLSLDGRGAVSVDHVAALTVPKRIGVPSMAGNAYRAFNDQVMPDMKRLPWNTRLKGEGEDFGFALPGLTAGGEALIAAKRPILVRIAGGIAPYRVELADAKGAVVARRSSTDHAVLLPAADLAPGTYSLSVADSGARTLSAVLTVVESPAPTDSEYAEIPDAEVRAAVTATALARAAPGKWAFEAEQILNAAPATGLDRDRVYELVESYGPE
jgi:hypothetical protein